MVARTYSLAQAVEVTGSSRGRFRYNKQRLIELGVTIAPDGEWSIPHDALVALGWVSADAPIVDMPLSRSQQLGLRVAELEAEVERLRGERGVRGIFRRR